MFQHNKGNMQETHSQSHPKREETQNVCTKIRKKTSSFFSLLVARAIKQMKEMMQIQTRKEEVKINLFPDDTILCIKA